jgi:colicin import membrane protein
MSTAAHSLLHAREATLLPQREDALGAGALMAVLAHIALVLALALAVQWHTHEPEGVEAELWASVPQIAAPKAVAPPEPTPTPKPTPKPEPQPAPPPKPVQRDADIAIEKAKKAELDKKQREDELKRQQAEKEKAQKDAEAKAQAEADRKQKEEDKKLAALRAELRKEQLQRMMGQVGGTGDPTSTGRAQRTAGPSATYAGRIIARIRPNIILTDDVSGNPATEVELRAGPDGSILSRRITKPSGNTAWDDAVLRAIDRTGMLPRDVDGTVPSPMILVFRPQD